MRFRRAVTSVHGFYPLLAKGRTKGRSGVFVVVLAVWWRIEVDTLTIGAGPGGVVIRGIVMGDRLKIGP